MTRPDYTIIGRDVKIFSYKENHVYICYYYGMKPGISMQTKRKLMRWSLKLSVLQYFLSTYQVTGMFEKTILLDVHSTRLFKLTNS